MLSSDIEARLQKAKQQESTYTANADTATQLKGKTLIMFVSPVAVGKSFVINKLADYDTRFNCVSVFTTRDNRPDDEPGMFRSMPHTNENVSSLLSMIEQGDVVQYAVHPATGNLYGSVPSDYAGEFNLLATMSGAVAQLQRAPFASTIVIGLVTSPTLWQERLQQRFPIANPDKQKRLKEAIISLEWLLAPERGDTICWVENSDDINKTIQSILNIVNYKEQGSPVAKRYAYELLHYAKQESK